jgi:hypothetical protein
MEIVRGRCCCATRSGLTIRFSALLDTLRDERREDGRPRTGSAIEEEREPEWTDSGAGARFSPHQPGRTLCIESEDVLRVRWWCGRPGWYVCVSAGRGGGALR